MFFGIGAARLGYAGGLDGRAGQISAASGPSASDGSMAVNCQAASHG